MHALIHLPDSLYTYLVCSCLSIQEPVAIKKKAPNHARDSIPVLGYTYTPNSITGPGHCWEIEEKAVYTIHCADGLKLVIIVA